MLSSNQRIKCPLERHQRRVGMLEMRNQGYTYALIAEKYGCKISTVRAIIFAFRNKLERLNKNGN